MNWLSFTIYVLLIIGGLVLYWLEYEVTPGMPELRHWWKTVQENYFIGTGMLEVGTWEAASALLDTPRLARMLDGAGNWLPIQILVGVLLLPIVLQVLLGVVKTWIKK